MSLLAMSPARFVVVFLCLSRAASQAERTSVFPDKIKSSYLNDILLSPHQTFGDQYVLAIDQPFGERPRPALVPRFIDRYLPSFLKTRSDHKEYHHRQYANNHVRPAASQYYYVPVIVHQGDAAVNSNGASQPAQVNEHVTVPHLTSPLPELSASRQKVFYGTILHDLKPNLLHPPSQLRHFVPEHGYVATRPLEVNNYIASRPGDDVSNWRESSDDQRTEISSDGSEKVQTEVQGAQPAASHSSGENRQYTEKEESTRTVEKINGNKKDSVAEPRYLIIIACVACFLLFVLIIVTLALIRAHYKSSRGEDHWQRDRRATSTFDPLARGWYYGSNFTHR